MSTRSTRSKQKAIEVANASPARSTRSGGHSLSPPALNVGKRSSSPASLRSASPVAASRGRGRGRGRGAATTSPKASKAVVEPIAKRGRPRGRPPKRSTDNCQTSLQELSVIDDEKTSHTSTDLASSVSTADVTSESTAATTADLLVTHLSNSDEISGKGDEHEASDAMKTMEQIQDTSVAKNEQFDDVKVDEVADTEVADIKVVDKEATDTKVSSANDTANDSVDQWVDTNLNLTENLEELTDENLHQLESVLTSEEGLKLLTEQPETVEAINDISIDDQVIQDSLEVDPRLIAQTLGNDTAEEAVEDEASAGEQELSAPRRKSERVTDLERRALAEKIRQENIRKEKEMLEKMQSDMKESEEQAGDHETDAGSSKLPQFNKVKQPAVAKVAESKAPKVLPAAKKVKESAKGKQAALKPAAKSLSTTSDKTPKQVKLRKSINKKQSQEKAEEVEPTCTKTPPDPSGWIPGKIKVIDRKSGSTEKIEKMKRKSQELKRRMSSATEDLFKPDLPTGATGKKSRREKAKQTLRPDEVSGGETSSSSEGEDEDDGEWKEEDDPDRLWCVCRQPHDNRFMICCDRCEEWYHGDCVGISRKRGTQMETENEEYICSQCKEKELVEQLGGAENLTESTALVVTSSTGDTSPIQYVEAVVEHTSTPVVADTSAADERTADGKPMGKLQGEIRKKKGSSSSSEKRKKFSMFQTNPPRQHCIGSGCENWAEENKIYCSLNCIIKHANESLDIINKEKYKMQGAKHEVGSKAVPDIVVMERHTGRLVTGAHAPVPTNLIPWLTRHPSFEVLRPGQQTGHVSTSSSSSKQKSKLLSSSEEKSHKRSNSTKEDEVGPTAKKPAGPDPSTIRSTVKKSLVDALKERIKETSDDKTTEDEIKSIAAAIEHELYKYNGDTNSKYKSRFRSLIFNVKDPKNKGLFRKILRKKLKPSKLVRMTPDELASKELHQWREKEMQSEIEKIKADEEMKASMKSTLRKITHKGEIEVEQDNFKDLDIKLEESVKDYEMSSHRESYYDPKPSLQSQPDQSVDILSSIMGSTDTTSQHDAHLFDSNCKICIGKQAAPSGADLEKSKSKVKVSHKVSKPVSRAVRESSKEEIDKAIKTELNDLEKEIKVFEEEDKRIAEKLEKHRRPHQEVKRRVKEIDSPKQEPSSTVRSPQTPPLPDLPSPTPMVKKRGTAPSAWKGFIDAPEISCKFFTTAHGVHGNSDCLKADLPDSLQIVGRIHQNQVWEYIGQLRHTMSREVILVRFSAVNEEEKIGYKTYFRYLSEKKRFGVVGNGSSVIKDMYIIPLPSHESLPVALKPYRHKVLADDNRPNMLVGLVVRSKTKRASSLDSPYGSKKVKSDGDEPYEPPGIADIVPAEPATPSPMTTPKSSEPFDNRNVEEYDPSQPLVGLSAPSSQGSQDEMDEDDNEIYDPIVSAYSLADSKTLNAEDVPGAAPYSPGQDDAEEMEEPYDPSVASLIKDGSEPYDPMPSEPYEPVAPLPVEPSEPYDPMAPLHADSPTPPSEPYNPGRASPPPDKPYDPAAALARTSPSPTGELYDPAVPLSTLSPLKSDAARGSASQTSVSSLKDTELTAQQLALKQLTEQVERQRRQLEEHKARLAQQYGPSQTTSPQHATPSTSSSNIPADVTTRTPDPGPVNTIDYTNQTPSAGTTAHTMVAPPPPAATVAANTPNIRSPEAARPKISFSLSGGRSVSHPAQHLTDDEAKPHRPYLPPASTPSPQSKAPLLAPPPPPPPATDHPSASHSTFLSDPRLSGATEQLPFPPAGNNDRDEDYRRRDYRREYDERGRWPEDYDERSRWRGPPAGRDGYQQAPHRDIDYRNRNRRGGYGADDRYYRDYQ